MVQPSWFKLALLSPEMACKRRRGTFLLMGENILLDFLGDSQVAVVKGYHRGRSFIPGDIVWVKEVAPDGITLLDVQDFGEGAPGALRGFILVHAVEGAKVEVLDRVTNELPKSLAAYLRKGSGGELPWALAAHLAVIGSFSKTLNNRFAFVDQQIRRMFSVFDRTGRPNRHCRIMGIESALEDITKVSKERQKTVGAAALAAATLGEVLKDYEAFLTNVKMFIKTKLDANTWSVNKRHRKWLESFSQRLSTWADDFFKMDMQPFTNDAETVRVELIEAHNVINIALSNSDKRALDDAQNTLKGILKTLGSMLLRFETARALRVVSLAADDRVRKFGIKINKPNWVEIEAIAHRAMEKWGVTNQAIIDDIGAHNADQAYTAFREIVRVYDDASRAAAA